METELISDTSLSGNRGYFRYQRLFQILEVISGVIYQSCWFLDLAVLYCCARDGIPRAHGMAAYVRDGYGAFRRPKFECGCFEMLAFMVCGARQNFYLFSLYRNHDLDDRIYDCLLNNHAVQAADARASFLFVSDLKGHHLEWLGSTTTNRHGVAALDFATVWL